MTARGGMADLIQALRGYTDAGTGDYTIGTVSYFSDEHMQGYLDMHRVDFYEVDLTGIEQTVNGSAVWTQYRSPYGNLEGVASGTTIFNLSDATGANVSTANWTADYVNGIVTFTSDQGGTSYNLTGRSYDVNAAAADVWRAKAANAAKSYDFSTDGHSMKRSQYMEACLKMANFYGSQAKPVTVEMYRSDCRS